MEATESSKGTSFSEISSVEVTVFSEQNSVDRRNSARASEWMYISFSFASMKRRHSCADMPADHITLTASSIVETSCDMPTVVLELWRL